MIFCELAHDLARGTNKSQSISPPALNIQTRVGALAAIMGVVGINSKKMRCCRW